MMTTQLRLDSISPALANKYLSADPLKRRNASVKACEAAIKSARLEGEDVVSAIKLLRRNDPVPDSLLSQLEERVADLDDAYFRLLDEVDDEVVKKKEALQYFSMARAASALVFALSADPDKAHEAIYEAIAAFEEPTEIMQAVEKILSS